VARARSYYMVTCFAQVSVFSCSSWAILSFFFLTLFTGEAMQAAQDAVMPTGRMTKQVNPDKTPRLRAQTCLFCLGSVTLEPDASNRVESPHTTTCVLLVENRLDSGRATSDRADAEKQEIVYTRAQIKPFILFSIH
jgi:hypothetical protein